MLNSTVSEVIDERILRLLGLEDVFDLDYDTYLSLLKESLVKYGVISKEEIPFEEMELLRGELKKIKGKVGRFRVKKEKIPTAKVATSKFLLPSAKKVRIPPSRLLPPSGGFEEGKEKETSNSSIVFIGKKLDEIVKNLTEQNKIEKKSSEDRRKSKEEEKRRKKEERLEGGFKAIKSIAQKILSPIQSILDRIIKFIVFTLLGRAFKLFMDWAADPKNKEKLKNIGRFLKDWWPILLGAWFFFANPLGRFIRTIVGTVLKLTFKLARFAIPRLTAFLMKNPLVTAGLVTGIAAGTGYIMEKGRKDELVAKEAKKEGKTPEQKSKEIEKNKSWFDIFGQAYQTGQLGMGGISPVGLNAGGSIGGYSGGASVFSGVVDKNTGRTVSGAGPDTQFLPIEGGGGAVLQKGESVLQVGARERMIEDHGIDPLSYNIGSNANRPKPIRNGIFARTYGGLIGLNNGGMIGEGIELKDKNTVVKDRPWNSGIPLKKLVTKSGLSYTVAHNLSSKFKGFVDELESTGYRIKYIGGYRRAGGSAEEQGTPAADYDKGRFAHPYGAGIDINKDQNPYREDGKLVTDFPPNISKMSKKYGLGWGGDWTSKKDTMHFSFLKNERGNGVDLNYGGPLWKLPFTPTKPKQQSEQQINPGFFGALTSGISSMFGMQKKEKGGVITESTGANIPGATADRQLINVAVQPGETKYIFTKRATERGAAELAEFIQAKLDPLSKAAMTGKYLLPPPTRRGNRKVEVLPPISSSSGPFNIGGSAPAGTVVPSFSAISSASYPIRMSIAKTYGVE